MCIRDSSTVDRAVDRTQTESNLLSVSRPGGRPFHATIDRAVEQHTPVHVVHPGRLPSRPVLPPVDRAVDRGHSRPATRIVSRSLCLSISVLSSDVSSISSLSTILYLGEDFSNLSRSSTNSSLSPDEIDTRSRRNRHTISAWNL